MHKLRVALVICVAVISAYLIHGAPTVAAAPQTSLSSSTNKLIATFVPADGQSHVIGTTQFQCPDNGRLVTCTGVVTVHLNPPTRGTASPNVICDPWSYINGWVKFDGRGGFNNTLYTVQLDFEDEWNDCAAQTISESPHCWTWSPGWTCGSVTSGHYWNPQYSRNIDWETGYTTWNPPFCCQSQCESDVGHGTYTWGGDWWYTNSDCGGQGSNS